MRHHFQLFFCFLPKSYTEMGFWHQDGLTAENVPVIKIYCSKLAIISIIELKVELSCLSQKPDMNEIEETGEDKI